MPDPDDDQQQPQGQDDEQQPTLPSDDVHTGKINYP